MRPVKIETERLILLPLTARQLRLWAEDGAALEKELGCRYDAEPFEGHLLEIVKGQIPVTEKDERQYAFHSFWFVIRREDHVVVGSSDFKTPPDQNGEVEIGYGLGKSHEHHGYMTEAVRAMCQWAGGLDGVSGVTAETETDNTASQRVLSRCGFSLFRRTDTLWWKWRPEKADLEGIRCPGCAGL